MKNMKFIFIAVFTFAFLFVSCENENDNDNNDDQGIFTIIEIPVEFNGKYARLSSITNSNYFIFGSQDRSDYIDQVQYTAVPIKNGSVTLPMWTVNTNTNGYVKYIGNDSVTATLYIYDSETVVINFMDGDGGFDPYIIKFSVGDEGIVTFLNGNAKINWNDLVEY